MPASDSQVLIIHADGKIVKEFSPAEDRSTSWRWRRQNEIAGPPVWNPGDLKSNPITQFRGRLAEEARDMPLDSVRTDGDPFLTCQPQGHRRDVGPSINLKTNRYISKRRTNQEGDFRTVVGKPTRAHRARRKLDFILHGMESE